MATAIIKGVATGSLSENYQIYAYDLDADKVESLSEYKVKNGKSIAFSAAL